MIACSQCGVEVPEDEILLGITKVPETDLYEELCADCYDDEESK